jgi:hypothetical protein
VSGELIKDDAAELRSFLATPWAAEANEFEGLVV